MRRRSPRRRHSSNPQALQIAAVAFVAIPLAMGSIALVAAIGATMAGNMQKEAESRLYALVETQGNGESDIRDYDLSASDCRAALITIAMERRATVGRFTCETIEG